MITTCQCSGRIRSLLLVFLSVGMAVPAVASDWAGFRGPGSRGISDDTDIPTQWDDTRNLKWRLELPGKGYSSPIVVKDRVFVTCYSDAEGDLSSLKRHLLCVDRNTGQIKWAKTIPSVVRERAVPGFAGRPGYASHTPVSDGERVYVLFGNSGVLAFDMSGQQLWQQDVGTQSASMFGSAASPILYKDHVIVMAGSESESLRALNTLTGDEVWKTEADSFSRSYATPVIVTNQQGIDEMLLPVTNEVWSMNPDNGKLKWYAEARIDTNACPSLVADNGVAYVIGGRGGGRAAIRLGGRNNVTESHVLWSKSGGSYVPSPVLHNGHLYWVNDKGIANCIDIQTGDEASRKRLNAQFYASLVLVGKHLYAVSRFDGTYVLEATPEFKQIAHNQLTDDSDFSASPAVSDGHLLLRSDRFLYCIATDEGQ
ncbi:MAG TPA: serine/threonine protein kinase [Planctomycetes bacterium]|nr:serine/threonine protein kinase [Fuerstiella sp.]HIK90803.1 serine/threonine protein kinase [Planctomycetota bacterium]